MPSCCCGVHAKRATWELFKGPSADCVHVGQAAHQELLAPRAARSQQHIHTAMVTTSQVTKIQRMALEVRGEDCGPAPLMILPSARYTAAEKNTGATTMVKY